VTLAPTGPNQQQEDFIATLTAQTGTQSAPITWTYDGDSAFDWETSFASARLRFRVSRSGMLAGTLTDSSGSHPLRGQKQSKLVLVNMYLDPRILDKVRVRILEGSFFEITNAFLPSYWPLIHNGDVLDLREFFDGPNWEGDAKWRDTFLPGTLDPYTEDDHIYGIPLAHYASVIWYNKKMFREHGWKAPVTWDDLFKLSTEIKKAGIAPMAFQGRYPDYASPLYDHAYYHLAGRAQWEARSRVMPGTFDCPESIEAISLVRRMANECFQSGALGMSHTESQLEFFLGHTAMIPCGAWLKSEMIGKIPDGFELGCFNMPVAEPSKEDATAVSVHVEPFFVFAHSPHPREAADFMRFMTSRRMAGRFAKMQDTPTAIRGTNEGNLSRDMQDLVQLISRARVSYGSIAGDAYPEMGQVYRDAMYQAIANVGTPDDVARTLEKRAAMLRNQHEHPDRVDAHHVWQPIALMSALGIGAIVGIAGIARSFKRISIARGNEVRQLQRLRLGNILLFLGPSILIYSAFVIIPSLRSFSWSLHEWNGLTPMASMPLKGLLNFKRLLLESDALWIALKNNLWLMIVVPGFVIPLALFLSACLSRGVWGSNLFRVVFFFPNLIGGVAATLLWVHLYNPQGGVVNAALSGIGLHHFEGFAWLEARHLYWALIPISIWGACGFNMVLYLAAMQSVPEDLYESATLEGASQWRQFWTITLPLIWEMVAISAVFMIIGGMKAFDVIWLLTNQQPTTDNHVVGTLMVQSMFSEFKVGEATAIAVLLFLMVFIGSAAMLRIMRRESVEL
jgi:raffinose/stachyose/melibiose transport system permease protein